MIRVESYDGKYKEGVFGLVKQFYGNTLEEFGMVLDDNTIAQYENSLEIFVLLKDDLVIGVLAGQLIEQLMSRKKMFQETIWYVDKDHRGHGGMLFDFVEKWCKDNGVGQIVMAYMHNSMPKSVHRFYESRGYRPMETHLIKELNHG